MFVSKFTKIEGCGCETCVPMGNLFAGTASDLRMILCAVCGNKRCPHATNHLNLCTNSNDRNQTGSAYDFRKKPKNTSSTVPPVQPMTGFDGTEACAVCWGRGTSLDGKACPFAPHKQQTYNLKEAAPAATIGPNSWEVNARMLLDSYTGSVRIREGCGPEDLMASMAVTFTNLRDAANAALSQQVAPPSIQEQLAVAMAELVELRKLHDPDTLHANLLRGIPAKLTTAHLVHLLASNHPYHPQYVQPAQKHWFGTKADPTAINETKLNE